MVAPLGWSRPFFRHYSSVLMPDMDTCHLLASVSARATVSGLVSTASTALAPGPYAAHSSPMGSPRCHLFSAVAISTAAVTGRFRMDLT